MSPRVLTDGRFRILDASGRRLKGPTRSKEPGTEEFANGEKPGTNSTFREEMIDIKPSSR